MSKTFANKSEYPLRWPGHIPRIRRPESSRFTTSLYQALQNVEHSLKLFAKDSGKQVTGVRLTSNVTLDQSPDDGAVAVYFNWNGADFCIAVDRYKKPAENLQAIHHIIEADRVKLRHGGIAFVMAEKRGQTLLIGDGSTADWREVLGVADDAGFEEVRRRYKVLCKKHHPDAGGDSTTFNRILDAYNRAMAEVAP